MKKKLLAIVMATAMVAVPSTAWAAVPAGDYTANTELALYSQPSKYQPTGTSITSGSEFIVVSSCDDGWCRVNYCSQELFAKITDSSQYTAFYAARSTYDLGSYQVTASTLNVRIEPRSDSSVIGTVQRGRVLSVSCQSGNWYRVETEYGTGWVSVSYMQKL